MNSMQKILIVVCISLLLTGGIVETANAYPAKVSYYFQGLDIDTGTIFTDPTMMILVGGKNAEEIEKILEPPPGIFPEFEPGADVYFEFEPIWGTSLVVIPENIDDPENSTHITGLTVNGEIIEIPDLDEHFSVPIGNEALVTFITGAGNSTATNITLNMAEEDFGVIVSTDFQPSPVPEPSMLVLFGFGLVGLLWIGRKKSPRWWSRLMMVFLLLLMVGTSHPVLAQTFSCDDVSEIPKAECEALVAIYNSTDGDNWKNTIDNDRAWLQTNTPCSWYGVTCSGSVTQLNLAHNGLTGDIPSEIADLNDLQTLNVYSNQLKSLPPEIGNLINLQNLNLWNNDQLTNVPSEIWKLTQLQHLSVNDSTLTSLPPEIGNLTNLKGLRLEGTALTSLPPEIGNLTKLEGLTISWSHDTPGLTLPPEIGKLINLQSISFKSAGLTNLPPEIGNLINLQMLEAPWNRLKSVPPEIGKLVNLEYLELGSNSLETLPSEIGKLSSLLSLRLAAVGLKSLPPEIGKLANLQELSLWHNHLTSVPSDLGKLSNLQDLDLHDNALTSLPSNLNNLINLQSLTLNDNPLSGQLPENLTNLTQLEKFYFNDTNLCESQDTVFQTWLTSISDVQSSGLTCLDSGVCESVAEIPQAECDALVTLYNHTSGDNWSDSSNWGQTNTPCSWYGVTCDGGSVASLALNGNQLSGSIPPKLEDLSNVRELLLYENQLIGSIPPELSHLTDLEILYLSDNQLNGAIPLELGDLETLKELWIGSNPFSGTIPVELSNLSNLLRLDVGDTQLTGSVPPELGNLTGLDVLYLWYTQLSGTLPANLTNLPALQNFYFNDTNLCEPPDTAFQNWLGAIPDAQRSGTACSVFDYFVYDEYEGYWHDVDKTGIDDDNMCWNFSSSNILDWTRWGDPDDLGLDTEHEIAGNVKANWENNAGMMKYLWRWWFDGTYPPDLGPEWSQLSNPNPLDPDADPKQDQNGRHWSGENFPAHYYSHWSRNVMAAVTEYLHSGYGVAISLYNKEASTDTAGHALTVWGYRYHADGTVVGLWVTDSDDGASNLRLLPVTYLANSNLYGLKWRVAAEDADYAGWLIEGAQALKPRNANTLRVRKAGTGTGNVVGSGIDCGADCVEPYSGGTQVSLIATPDADSVFERWEGACNGSGDCVVTVDGETQVTAVFATQEPGTFMITANTDPGVTVYPAENVQVSSGSDATFIFAPYNHDDGPGHVILDVLVDGYSVGPVTAYTFTDVSADHTIGVRTIRKDAKLAIARKKCIKMDRNGDVMDDNGQEEEIACVPGENAIIYVGDKVCDSECMRTVVPFTDGSALILKVVLDEGNGFTTKFIRWEINGGGDNIDRDDEDRIRYSLEDILLEPVIGCNHG